MRRIPALAVALCLAVVSTVHAAEGMRTIASEHDVATTADRLVNALKDKGMTVFARIDHAAGAKRAGLTLAPTELVIFGNPKVGTRLMQCARSTAIDLPMKMLVWKNDSGVHIGYNTPEYLAERHGIEGCDQVLEKVGNALDAFARAGAGE
ncbi:DUF302 domain-containing protein [Arhodomonas sp. AD133]|uniref:DUF302 domain-containing protein n=1 Tax=Arhodomonas sp. AD133 TaxID=3415009 RepID=UPI003EBDAAFA